LSGRVFPLAEAWENDPVDQVVTAGFELLISLYVLFGAWGALLLWRRPSARIAVAIMVCYIVVRTVFMATLETPEPRYMLVCFPSLLAIAAQVFAGKAAGKEDFSATSEQGLHGVG
jgi:peptidoglycan/LPS O-acetylase OafA/YrhL